MNMPSRENDQVEIMPSHVISIDLPNDANDPWSSRSPICQPLSSPPEYHSPLRHHKRTPSQYRKIKETLNASSKYTNNEEDGRAEHHINQYIIKDEIGRGSFGAVHLAVDQYGMEYAVKEFSKSRLRKRAQSNILRRPHHDRRRPGHLAAGIGFNSPLHRRTASNLHRAEEQGNPLYLIKEEIAIMKKLNHPNLVQLIEVLDDPEEDSLYMILEMCKKGVVMKVGLGEQADPYPVENCRHWFRDLILGIEYLHAQGIVHRDIKPDNLLLTENDVLKIVDFGVSEIFEKESDMMTAKSAGSPAFLPPELCVPNHGNISGKAADIWSMGVSLYCLRFGRIPFESVGVLELYEAIKNRDVKLDPEQEPEFIDLIKRILEKDPQKRIKMSELREHPWVTKNGADPLLSLEENTSDLLELPTRIEVNHAITIKMRNLMVMMRAVQKFKTRVEKKRAAALCPFGKGIRNFHSLSITLKGVSSSPKPIESTTESVDKHQPEKAAAQCGALMLNSAETQTWKHPVDSAITRGTDVHPFEAPVKKNSWEDNPRLLEGTGEKGHAHDPLDAEPPSLGIGNGASDDGALSVYQENIVAESPAAAQFNIYDAAYQQEVERIQASQGHSAVIYLTRRVDGKNES